MMRKLLLIGLLMSPLCLLAQKGIPKEKDKLYVEKLKPILSIRPYTNQNIDLLFLNFNDSEASPLMYRPATGLNVGGEIAFSFLHFNYQRNLPLLQPSQAGNMETRKQSY